MPVVVSNYLDRPQSVTLSLQDAPWFERLEPAAERTLELKPNEVRSTSLPHPGQGGRRPGYRRSRAG